MPRSDPSRQTTPSPGKPIEYDEPELVRRAQLGSVAAFERLVVERGPQLHRYLAVRLRHEADALDALQETLTAAWQGLPGLETSSKFWPWLCGIAAHKAADAARRRLPGDERERQRPDRDQDGLLDLRLELARLPEHLRQVLLLRHIVGLSEEEVAEALGIRVGTVKSRGARARRALRQKFR